MQKPTVWIQPGVIMIYGSSFDATPHSHYAMQLVWPKYKTCFVFNQSKVSELLIIDSNVEHQLQMSEGWILLIEPKSRLGQALSDNLTGEPFKMLGLCSYPTIEPIEEFDGLNKQFASIIEGLVLPLLSGSIFENVNEGHIERSNENLNEGHNENTVKDKRILNLINRLDGCLQGECIKPASWRASEVALQMALSESRFLHLFRQEVGIAWRPYLLWRRMICAIQAMLKNNSATEAAHQAGFSDSSHLSRTFRNTFGMTISQAHSILGEK